MVSEKSLFTCCSEVVGFVSDVRKGAHSRAPTLLHAQEVSVNLIAPKQMLEELTNLGVCRAAGPQIDEDLAPWELTGSVISEDIVRDVASRSVCSRYCNRVLVVNGSLHIVWAHQDQEHESTSHGCKVVHDGSPGNSHERHVTSRPA